MGRTAGARTSIPATGRNGSSRRARFTFNGEGRAQLAGVFAGTTKEWVNGNTGFSFGLAPDFSEIAEPTEEELSVLRHEVDPDAVLRH